ncbi:RNA-directed DNA polymerase, eukaryota, reverse transcriptase zinc-binding domain protein [Tanacetum coccineum]
MERGLKQGDPLSPFIFLIVAEALQVMMIDACNKGIYKGLSLANDDANVSLLQYADDALFFGEWSKSNMIHLLHILNCFHDVSGLEINLSKSRLFGIGVSGEEVANIARGVNCSYAFLPFTYLGLPVAPEAVISQLESIRRHFFWGMKDDENKMVWIRWQKILSSKKDGGLETYKNCPISDRCSFVDGVWEPVWAWLRQPRGRSEGDVSSLTNLLNGLVLDPSHDDKWVWSLESSGIKCPGQAASETRGDGSLEDQSWKEYQNVVLISRKCTLWLKEQNKLSVEDPIPVSGLTRAAEDLGWSRWLGESGKRILFIHVTRTSDGSTDALNIPKSASLPHLKNELKDSFTQLVPRTYTIRYHGEAIETDLAWKNCVQAFGETGNRCMKLSIHE